MAGFARSDLVAVDGVLELDGVLPYCAKAMPLASEAADNATNKTDLFMVIPPSEAGNGPRKKSAARTVPD
jgi:hypothetical protein